MAFFPLSWSACHFGAWMLIGISLTSTFSLLFLPLLPLAPGAYIGPITTGAGAILLFPDAVKDRATLRTALDLVCAFVGQEMEQDKQTAFPRGSSDYQPVIPRPRD